MNNLAEIKIAYKQIKKRMPTQKHNLIIKLILMNKLVIILVLPKIHYTMNLEISHQIITHHLKYNLYVLGNR